MPTPAALREATQTLADIGDELADCLADLGELRGHPVSTYHRVLERRVTALITEARADLPTAVTLLRHDAEPSPVTPASASGGRDSLRREILAAASPAEQFYHLWELARLRVDQAALCALIDLLETTLAESTRTQNSALVLREQPVGVPGFIREEQRRSRIVAAVAARR